MESPSSRGWRYPIRIFTEAINDVNERWTDSGDGQNARRKAPTIDRRTIPLRVWVRIDQQSIVIDGEYTALSPLSSSFSNFFSEATAVNFMVELAIPKIERHALLLTIFQTWTRKHRT